MAVYAPDHGGHRVLLHLLLDLGNLEEDAVLCRVGEDCAPPFMSPAAYQHLLKRYANGDAVTAPGVFVAVLSAVLDRPALNTHTRPADAPAVLLLSGCFGVANQVTEPDDQFGHRIEGDTGDGRRTIVIGPADESRSYNIFPATYQSVKVRIATLTDQNAATGVAVELLIKGAFPDACTALHRVNQERSGHIVNVNLEMRRPQGAVCATVLRPYRFYLTLDGTFAEGSYSVLLNDRAHAFEVRRE